MDTFQYIAIVIMIILTQIQISLSTDRIIKKLGDKK